MQGEQSYERKENTFEFDIEEENLDDFEDGEQNLEYEADEMVKAWNRTEILEEVKSDWEKMKHDHETHDIEYYDGKSSFDDIAATMVPLDDTKQVYIKMIESNPDGKEIKSCHTILYDCIGYLEYQPDPFESSIHDGKPCKLNLILGPILPGMLSALINLKEGDKANILIRPSMAYGPLGCLPIVPGHASLYYYVKIYKVWEESKLDCLLDYERTNIMEFPIEQKLALVEEHKQIANTYLADDLPREAIIRYKAAIKCMDEVPIERLVNDKELSKLMVTLLQNAAIAFNKLGMYKSATKVAKRALFFDSISLKAYYHLIKARIGLCDFSGATHWLERANRISPDDLSIQQLKRQVNCSLREEKEKRDEILEKMSRAFK